MRRISRSLTLAALVLSAWTGLVQGAIPRLLNVDFTAAESPALAERKVGFAAVGQTAGDVWNVYSRDDGRGGVRPDGALANLKWADGLDSGIGLTITNAAGAWFTDSRDPMMNSFLYPIDRTGNIIVTITNLPPGGYDLFLYAHGLLDTENGVLEVRSGSESYGDKATTASPGWNTTHWLTGLQYVAFENVIVSQGQAVVVTSKPGASGLAVINGLQIVQRFAVLDDGITPAWRERYFGPDHITNADAAAIADPDGDGAGNFQEFLAGTDPRNPNSVLKVPCSVSTFAGSTEGTNDGFRTEARFIGIPDLVFDAHGQIWVPDGGVMGYDIPAPGLHRLRFMGTNEVISTFAGAEAGLMDGPASLARFGIPQAFIFDSQGAGFLLERGNHRIRRTDPRGTVSTFAGSSRGYRDGPATEAQFDVPLGLCADAADNFYVADFFNLRIRKVTPQGEVSTFAGGNRGQLNGPRAAATFDSPADIVCARDGTLFVADWSNGMVRKIDTNGIVSTFASGMRFVDRVSLDSAGNVYASGGFGGISKFSPDGGLLWTIRNPSGRQDGPIAQARFTYPSRVLERPDGQLLVSDAQTIRLITLRAPPLLEIQIPAPGAGPPERVTFTTKVSNTAIHYTLDRSAPTQSSPLYTGDLVVTRPVTIQARLFVNDIPISEIISETLPEVPVPPRITEQPKSLTVFAGTDASFSVLATGTAPLRFQWRWNGQAISGATNRTLNLANVQPSSAGAYSVAVSNAQGSVLSQSALLTVLNQADFVQRDVPLLYSPGVKLRVQFAATPTAGTASYAIEETPPPGWAVSDVSAGGSYDASRMRVKFGPFFDRLPRNLSYSLTPPFGETGSKEFSGLVSVDGKSVAIGGDLKIDPAPMHPSDRSPADFRITIDEMTAYGAAWRSDARWPADPNPIHIDYVTRAGFLWKNGENYLFNSSVSTAPLCWEPSAARGVAAVRPQGWLAVLDDPPRTTFAERVLPAWVEPRSVLAVEIKVVPGAQAGAYAVQDQVPAGWTVATISHEGSLDFRTGRVKWGPFVDSTPRTFRYQITSPATPFDRASFHGLVSVDGVAIPVTGAREVGAATRLSSLVRLSDGRLRVNSSAWTGTRAVVEVSPDLRQWTSLGIFTIGDGSVTFADPEALGQSRRFYRVTPP